MPGRVLVPEYFPNYSFLRIPSGNQQNLNKSLFFYTEIVEKRKAKYFYGLKLIFIIIFIILCM